MRYARFRCSGSRLESIDTMATLAHDALTQLQLEAQVERLRDHAALVFDPFERVRRRLERLFDFCAAFAADSVTR